MVPTLRTQIRLKPYRSYTFDEINITNLSIKSVNDIVKNDCDNIQVFSEANGVKLSCHEHGFEVRSITVQNTGSKMLDLDVSIRGIKQKKVFRQMLNNK